MRTLSIAQAQFDRLQKAWPFQMNMKMKTKDQWTKSMNRRNEKKQLTNAKHEMSNHLHHKRLSPKTMDIG